MFWNVKNVFFFHLFSLTLDHMKKCVLLFLAISHFGPVLLWSKTNTIVKYSL